MIKIEWTAAMEAAYWSGHDAMDVPGALEAMTPEAQRDLAAQLLRAASEREGFTQNEVKH